jgi:HlyD family secretion protein
LFSVDDQLQRAEFKIYEAQLENARQALHRAESLLKAQSGPQKTFEDAEAALRTAEARLIVAQTNLDRRKIASPVSGMVHRIYFRPGEFVPAGRPVLALQPPENTKVRFFVPQPERARVSVGDIIEVHCDGCEAKPQARISFVAETVEFTPPVIYSLQERAKLVYMVEAIPLQPEGLKVGQPVGVSLRADANVAHIRQDK